MLRLILAWKFSYCLVHSSNYCPFLITRHNGVTEITWLTLNSTAFSSFKITLPTKGEQGSFMSEKPNWPVGVSFPSIQEAMMKNHKSNCFKNHLDSPSYFRLPHGEQQNIHALVYKNKNFLKY